jgi:hypothetical protein
MHRGGSARRVPVGYAARRHARARRRLPMRNLTLRGLRVFEAAATTGGFSRAGELMGMSQSAVSQQIRQLEDELGARLFDTLARPIRWVWPKTR